MNVESSNLINVLPSAVSLEGGASTTPVDGAISEIFGDALKVQLQLLEGQSTNKVSVVSEVVTTIAPSTEPVKMQDLADLLGKDLPVSYKVEDGNDLHAALSVVTDSWKYLGAEAKPFSGEAKLEKLDFSQALLPETIAEPAPVEPLQMAEAKVDVGQVIKKPQETKETKQDLPEVLITVPSGVEQMPIQPPVQIQIPLNTGLDNVNTDAESLSVISQFGTTNKTNAPVQSDSAKDNALSAKALDEGAQVTADAPVKFQLSAGENKLTPQDPEFSVESHPDINIAATAVNGQNDKLPVEAKTEVPALSRPLTHPEWNKDLGERIVWMNNRAMPAAEIKLNPQHLGPVSVRIDMNHDQASIVFTSQHAVVREALEASVPKLREMLNDQQISLVNVSVSQQSSSEQRNSQPQVFNQFEGELASEGVDGVGNVDQNDNERVVVSNGLLNMYA